VGADDLAPVDPLAGEVRLLLAARVGPERPSERDRRTTRLIDNVGVTVEPGT